jgi:hypothetical protein
VGLRRKRRLERLRHGPGRDLTDIIETDTLQQSDGTENTSNNDRKTKKNYLAMREFWVGYSGFTPYPGEILKSVASACAMTTANGATPTSKR